MDCETFTLRKNILEEFLKERVKLITPKITFDQNIITDSEIMDYVEGICFITNAKYPYNLNIDVKEVYKLIKPFIYYLFSVTYKKKFLYGKPLFT